MKVLFVCSGNICRSPAAAALFDKMTGYKHDVKSAGMVENHVGEHASPKMRATAWTDDLVYDHVAQQVTENMIEWADLILVTDFRNWQRLKKRNWHKKAVVLRRYDADAGRWDEIPDPYKKPTEFFQHSYDIIKKSVEGLVDYLEG